MTDFDRNDLEALRRLVAAPDECKGKLDGRQLRNAGARREVQFNTRVRAETKEKALELAKAGRSTIADVLERAIEKLYAEHLAQEGQGPTP